MQARPLVHNELVLRWSTVIRLSLLWPTYTTIKGS